jgi:hypothetical protein
MYAPGANIGARGADAAQDILHGGADWALVWENHRLALAGPVLRHSAWGKRGLWREEDKAHARMVRHTH